MAVSRIAGPVREKRARAVFLDKDGTLVVNVPYNAEPAQMRLAPNAGHACALLADAGFLLFVVSNQSGVARGEFPIEALEGVEKRLRELLAPEGVELSGFYVCPHHPEGTVERYAVDCTCRKPEPGLLLRAAADHDIDLASSWFVGDILDDIEAGRRAGCRTALVDAGNETEWVLTPGRMPHLVAGDLAEAARFMVHASQPLEPERVTADG